MALGRYDRGNSSPAAPGPDFTPNQHALSFEGAGRFWKPKDERESSWRFLKFKGGRSRALSSPRPEDIEPHKQPSPFSNSTIPSPYLNGSPNTNILSPPTTTSASTPSSNTNVGAWLTAQSILGPPDEPAVDDLPQQIDKAETRDSLNLSLSSSDEVSVRTVSSTTSLANAASQSRFKSLSDQIADDERKRKARNHLKRIMEAEEARVSQIDPLEDAQELDSDIRKAEEVELEDARTVEQPLPEQEGPQLTPELTPERSRTPVEDLRRKSESLPNALRLTFEPETEGWDINTLLRGSKLESAEKRADTQIIDEPSRTTALLDHSRKNSTEALSVRTVTVVDDKLRTASPPPLPEVEERGSPTRSLRGSPRQSQIEPQRPSSPSPKIERTGSPAGSLHSNPRQPQSEAKRPPSPLPEIERSSSPVHLSHSNLHQSQPEVKSLPPSAATNSEPKGQLRRGSAPASAPKSHLASPSKQPPPSVSVQPNRSVTPVLTISPPPTPPQEAAALPAVTDTLFQDLNRLKMSSSRRSAMMHRPVENRSYSVPTGPPKARHSPSSSLSNLNPSPKLVSTITPIQRPASTGVIPGKALPIPPPPIPDMAVELSTSASVLYKPKPPRADERYRRVRQHSDAAIYNTLPAEPYPLINPQTPVEAPPSEEEMQDLQRSVSPRKSIEAAASDAQTEPHVNIEPDIDPRTGLPWLNRGPLNPFGAAGKRQFRLF